MLKVCPIVVSNSDGIEIQTYALFDEGSTVTLIDEDLADQLNLNGPAQALNVSGINSTKRERTSRIVHLKLRGKTSKGTHIIRARTIRNMQLQNQTVPIKLMQYPHLRNLDPSSVCYEQARPRLLIGSDNWELIVSRELLTGRRHEPAASRTELGWVIHGSAPRATLTHEDEQVLHIRTGKRTAKASVEKLDAEAFSRSKNVERLIDRNINRSEESAKKMNFVHDQAGFILRGWNANSQRTLASIPDQARATIPNEPRAPEPTHLGSDHSYQEQTQGLLWLPTNDILNTFNTSVNRVQRLVGTQNQVPTKSRASHMNKQALSDTMAIYDQHELLSQLTIKAKTFIQNLWRLRVGWDGSLPTKLSDDFSAWLQNPEVPKELRLPRRYNTRGARPMN